jgi:hypothetical protein
MVAAQANTSPASNDSSLTSEAARDEGTARKPITKQWWFRVTAGVFPAPPGGEAASGRVSQAGTTRKIRSDGRDAQ